MKAKNKKLTLFGRTVEDKKDERSQIIMGFIDTIKERAKRIRKQLFYQSLWIEEHGKRQNRF